MFDAKLGERINATSSAVDCDASYDEKAGTVSGSCSVPLTTIRVDNEDTKTEHFQQWATNKKMEAKDCKFEAKLTGVKIGKLVAETPVQFTADVPFTICGRARTDGGKEKVSGNAILFPPGSYGEAKTIRVRATIQKFNRDKYRIGPKYTEGWLAKVQSLAKVVADEGTIELSLFAKAGDSPFKWRSVRTQPPSQAHTHRDLTSGGPTSPCAQGARKEVGKKAPANASKARKRGLLRWCPTATARTGPVI